MWISWTLQATVGIGLSLLGLLDLGSKSYHLSGGNIPVYDVLDTSWILPIVAIAYASLIGVDCIVIILANNAEKKKRYDSSTFAAPTGTPPMQMRGDDGGEKADTPRTEKSGVEIGI